MPIADENVPERPTPFQALVMAIHAKLDQVLAAEGRAAPELVFGKLSQGKYDNPPRVAWMQIGGHFVQATDALATTAEDVASPIPIKPLGCRRAIASVAMWHVTPEHLEHMLDRLWLACDRTTPEGNPFRWLIAKYDFPTERVDEYLKNGASVIVVTLPVDLPVPSEYDGENVLTTLNDTQLRAGVEDVIDTTTPGQPQFILNEWA